MLRPSRHLVAAVGIAAALAMVTPATAIAGGAAHPGSYSAHSVPVAKPAAFPSAGSTVVASVGFIDAKQVGYFWSAARGDSVEQKVKGPGQISRAILKLDVIDNVLNNAETDWTMSIDGKDVGSFVISQGQLGPISKRFSFNVMAGGHYDVKIRMTNEVPSGDGSITLRYAGDGPHSIRLCK
jgi:hypothetical protein